MSSPGEVVIPTPRSIAVDTRVSSHPPPVPRPNREAVVLDLGSRFVARELTAGIYYTAFAFQGAQIITEDSPAVSSRRLVQLRQVAARPLLLTELPAVRPFASRPSFRLADPRLTRHLPPSSH